MCTALNDNVYYCTVQTIELKFLIMTLIQKNCFNEVCFYLFSVIRKNASSIEERERRNSLSFSADLSNVRMKFRNALTASVASMGLSSSDSATERSPSESSVGSSSSWLVHSTD